LKPLFHIPGICLKFGCIKITKSKFERPFNSDNGQRESSQETYSNLFDLHKFLNYRIQIRAQFRGLHEVGKTVGKQTGFIAYLKKNKI